MVLNPPLLLIPLGRGPELTNCFEEFLRQQAPEFPAVGAIVEIPAGKVGIGVAGDEDRLVAVEASGGSGHFGYIVVEVPCLQQLCAEGHTFCGRIRAGCDEGAGDMGRVIAEDGISLTGIFLDDASGEFHMGRTYESFVPYGDASFHIGVRTPGKV